MNCPMHNLIFRSRGRSYRELPLRLFEFGTVYRYEKSGVVHGLTRARGFTQDDAHIYCTREQMQDELAALLTFVLDLLRDYGLDDFYLELSTRTTRRSSSAPTRTGRGRRRPCARPPRSRGWTLVPDPGGAAFYGPKISVQATDAIGRTWQMSTIQVDFKLPERFGLEYTAADGTRQRPVMIHRALFGSIERFFGVLHRALRRRVPGLAGAGAGGRHPGRRRAGAAPGARRHGAAGPRRPGRGGRSATTGCRRRSAPTPCRRCRSCCSPAAATSRRARSASGSATARQLNGVPVDDAVERSSTGCGAGRTPRRPPTTIPGRCAHAVNGPADELVAQDGVGVADGFRRLWTPHRLAYIKEADEQADRSQGCPFCRIPTLPDEEGLVVARGERGLRGAQPAPVQPRPPDGAAVPARRGLEDLTARRDGRADGLHPPAVRAMQDGRGAARRSTSG